MDTSRALMFRGLATLVATALLSSNLVNAQSGRANAAGEDELVVIVYEVRDLVMSVADHSYSGTLESSSFESGRGLSGEFGRGFGGGGAGAEVVDFDSLIDLIESTVAVDTWAGTGGGDAEIRPFGTTLSLIISQTPAVHRQIEALLKQLREGSVERRNVAIDARWLLLDSDELERLLATGQDGSPRVDRNVLAELSRRPTSIRGMTTCFSGQLVYVVSGTRRNIVSGYIPIVGSGDPGVGYQPSVERLNFGALLEIRPTLVGGTGMAVVDLKSTITVPGQGAVARRMGPEASLGPPMVDRIAVDTHDLATTLRVPMGQPVLVGGLTFMPPAIGSRGDDDQTVAGQRQEASQEHRQLYLVLELR